MIDYLYYLIYYFTFGITKLNGKTKNWRAGFWGGIFINLTTELNRIRRRKGTNKM
jgi:hypothetical protein